MISGNFIITIIVPPTFYLPTLYPPPPPPPPPPRHFTPRHFTPDTLPPTLYPLLQHFNSRHQRLAEKVNIGVSRQNEDSAITWIRVKVLPRTEECLRDIFDAKMLIAHLFVSSIRACLNINIPMKQFGVSVPFVSQHGTCLRQDDQQTQPHEQLLGILEQGVCCQRWTLEANNVKFISAKCLKQSSTDEKIPKGLW